MKKEHTLSLITLVMTVAFFVALLWGYSQYQQNQRAMAYLENEYQRSYYSYLEDLKQMAETAGKAQSASALQRVLLLGRLSALAQSAGDNFSTLPVQQARYQQSATYVNQVADYADSLATQLARGKELTEQDQKNLQAIYEKLRDIHGQMEEMERVVAAGGIVFAAAVQDSTWQTLRRSLGGSQTAQGEAAAVADESADGFFTRANALLDGLEPLEYQGKFSAHMANLPARGLADAGEISPEEAADIATKFLEQIGITDFKHNGAEEISVNSNLPLYSLMFEQGAGGVAEDAHIYVAVSKMGGQIISYFAEQVAGSAQIEAEAAIGGVEEILKAAGYESLRLVSREREGDELLLKYAHYKDDILYYPDSISVKVALDDGHLTALNAREFWMNHHERELPESMATAEDAMLGLGENAQVSGSLLTYISDGAGGETLCHEITHTVGEEQYLTYIGVEEMMEEQVLRSFSSEDGSFYHR